MCVSVQCRNEGIVYLHVQERSLQRKAEGCSFSEKEGIESRQICRSWARRKAPHGFRAVHRPISSRFTSNERGDCILCKESSASYEDRPAIGKGSADITETTSVKDMCLPHHRLAKPAGNRSKVGIGVTLWMRARRRTCQARILLRPRRRVGFRVWSLMPPSFEMLADLMRLNSLDVADAPPLLTLGFRFTDDSTEAWTRRFNAFKNGESSAVAAGARCLATAFHTIRFREGRVVVVGAVSSSDWTLAPLAPVRRLGETLSIAKGWEWRPELIYKRPHDSLHSLRSAAERDAAVRDAYRASTVDGERGLFLIVDDFCTRGSTTAAISRALLSANPGWRTYSATLAKTERITFWQGRGGISNHHVPQRLATAWDG